MRDKTGIPSIDEVLKTPAHPHRRTGGRRFGEKREYDPDLPVVSVITIVRNREEVLPRAINSVLKQSYPNIEYIIIDGASSDGTLEVIKQFENKIDLWMSEPDSGTSEAYNKGLAVSQGDYIFGLSSDDWIDLDYIEKAARALLKSKADFVFGDMAMHNPDHSVVTYQGREDYIESFMSGWPCFNFPAIVTKRECFQKIGLINMTYRFIADYEWLLRLHVEGGRGFYSGSLLIHRDTGGLGESDLFSSAKEHLRLLNQYRLPKMEVLKRYLHLLIRRFIGHFAKLFLPSFLYKKIKHAVRGV